MSYFEHHVFFCCNQRALGKGCCANHDADLLRAHTKQRINELSQNGKGRIRINSAGCLGRCDTGPTLVVYPSGIWYTYLDKTDIDEIIDEHLVRNRVVERLLMTDANANDIKRSETAVIAGQKT